MFARLIGSTTRLHQFIEPGDLGGGENGADLFLGLLKFNAHLGRYRLHELARSFLAGDDDLIDALVLFGREVELALDAAQ